MKVLSILLVIQAISLVMIKKAMQSVLFLILIFLNVSSILLLLKMEFLALILVVVYIGAITVLFIFVVMMLNIKLIELYKVKRLYKYIPLIYLLSLVILFLFILLIEVNFFNENINRNITISWEFLGYKINNLSHSGLYLFVYFFYYIIVISFLLLIVLVGAILLSIDKYLITIFFVKKQIILRQVKSLNIVKKILN